jgi:hypothetical protein
LVNHYVNQQLGELILKFSPDDIVKTCPKLESGLRFGPDGIRACTLGPFSAPLYWDEVEAASLNVTKELIVEKREQLFQMLNDDYSDVICKKCSMVEEKKFSEVNFTQLGRIDHAPRTVCNLRCNFCAYTHAEDAGDERNAFVESKYDSLKFLQVFNEQDVRWDAAVDFNGGETSLIKNLKGYLDYFRRMKISILCFTNGVKYSEAMAEALRDGVIQWLVVSIDAGTPSTYEKTKRVDAYSKVLENSSKYAAMGGGKGGSFAVKYIFTQDNCSDDDVYGFVYAMLAIQPQKIWLTFDFTPFETIPPDADDYAGFDFSKQIKAYAKMYLAFKKHGLEPVHYTEGHLAKISKPGQKLLRDCLHEISKSSFKLTRQDVHKENMLIKNFRVIEEVAEKKVEMGETINIPYSNLDDLVTQINQNVPKEHAIAIAPATEEVEKLLYRLNGQRNITLLDRNVSLHGRTVMGAKVLDYSSLADLNVQSVVLISPSQHQQAIQKTIREYWPSKAPILTCSKVFLKTAVPA